MTPAARQRRQHDDVIVLLAVGARYEALFESLRPQFERYAEACNADLMVCTAPPDPAMRRNILYQKMLLADLCRDWACMAFIDLDVLIARDAQSIFEALPDGAGLAALVDPRGTPVFENVVRHLWKLPEILDETHESYFASRGFAPFPAGTPFIGSINGGALLCRPALVADMFKGAYHGDFEMRVVGSGFVERQLSGDEEPMMAWLTQAKGMFAPLPDRFNHLFLYSLMADPGQRAVRWMQSVPYKLLRRADVRVRVPAQLYDASWRALVEQSLDTHDIVHFAGGYPFRGLATG